MNTPLLEAIRETILDLVHQPDITRISVPAASRMHRRAAGTLERYHEAIDGLPLHILVGECRLRARLIASKHPQPLRLTERVREQIEGEAEGFVTWIGANL